MDYGNIAHLCRCKDQTIAYLLCIQTLVSDMKWLPYHWGGRGNKTRISNQIFGKKL